MSDQTIAFLLRITARLSGLLFLCAFAGESVRMLWPASFTHWLADHQRGFTLGFVTSHTLHLGVIGAKAAAHGGERFLHETGAPTLVLGGVIYLLIFGLAIAALTSAPVSRRPARFQSVAFYVIWAALARPFLMRTLESPVFYLPLAVAFMAAFAVRVIGAVLNRRQTDSAEAP